MVPLIGEGCCGVGGASRDSAGLGAMEEGLISRGDRKLRLPLLFGLQPQGPCRVGTGESGLVLSEEGNSACLSNGSGVEGCPLLGVPAHRPLPLQLQPLGPRLHGHFQPEPPWPLAWLQHCPPCPSSPRSAEGLEASGSQRELGMPAAGEEAQLAPWMKSLGSAQQAEAFPLQQDKEGIMKEGREISGRK